MSESNEVAQALAEYLNRHAGLADSITPETDLIDSGVLESLTMMELLAHIHECYGVALEPGDIAPRHFQTTVCIAELVLDRSVRAVGAEIG